MDAHSFLQQQRTFAVHGYALNPSAVSNDPSSTYVGNVASAAENNFALIENIKGTHMSRRENKRKRQGKGDAGVVDGDGAYLGPWAGWEGEKEEGVEELEEDAEEWRAEKRRREEQQEATREKMKKAGEEKSIFHGQYNPRQSVLRRSSRLASSLGSLPLTGKSLTDYAGRTYMHIPTDLGVNLKPDEDTPAVESFIPQTCAHTWVSRVGDAAGVSWRLILFARSNRLDIPRPFRLFDCSPRAVIFC